MVSYNDPCSLGSFGIKEGSRIKEVRSNPNLGFNLISKRINLATGKSRRNDKYYPSTNKQKIRHEIAMIYKLIGINSISRDFL